MKIIICMIVTVMILGGCGVNIGQNEKKNWTEEEIVEAVEGYLTEKYGEEFEANSSTISHVNYAHISPFLIEVKEVNSGMWFVVQMSNKANPEFEDDYHEVYFYNEIEAEVRSQLGDIGDSLLYVEIEGFRRSKPLPADLEEAKEIGLTSGINIMLFEIYDESKDKEEVQEYANNVVLKLSTMEYTSITLRIIPLTPEEYIQAKEYRQSLFWYYNDYNGRITYNHEYRTQASYLESLGGLY